MNQLINEKSLYLLQHATNPIQWLPWSKLAFDKAKRENKPIFLSIGYSSCHWCHVMASESFEDEEVAHILNESYIAIKVDREERPDIDTIYMGVCVALNGSGGWPLTIIMTPDQIPFFAGTYLPKKSHGARLGLLPLLKHFSKQWQEDQDELLNISKRIETFFIDSNEDNKMVELTDEWFDNIFAYFSHIFDQEHGGYKGAPKFPSFNAILFWLKDDKTIDMAEKTLLEMAKGGIYDQIEGGFFRYATDEKWLIPHFEKMLYDNALAILTYSEASIKTSDKINKAIFKRMALETYYFLKKKFYEPEVGFFASSSADIDGEEGAYYLWDLDELIISFSNYQKIIKELNLSEKVIDHKSLPHLTNISVKGVNHDILTSLGEYRNDRMRLPLDKKIITSWNALMIVALTKLLDLANRPLIKEISSLIKEGLAFIEESIVNNHGRLGTCYIDGKVSGDGFIDDYAYLSYAYYIVYQKTGDASYLEKCHHLLHLTIDYFFDHLEGGFYLTSEINNLFYRPKETSDTSIPASNALLLLLLGKIRFLIPNGYYENIYRLQLNYIQKALRENPLITPFGLIALRDELKGIKYIVYHTNKKSYQEVLKRLKKKDNNSIILIISKENAPVLKRIFDYEKTYPLINDLPTFYLCANGRCYPPVNDISEIEKELG